jgi:hypothetical protein
MFCIHVDDFAIASTQPQYTEELLTLLRQRYIVTTSDTLESFLGILIEAANSSLYLSQPGLITKILTESGMTDASPKSTPMVATYDELLQDDSPPCDRSVYRRLLGMVMFLLRTRPDISYAVTRLATRTSTATDKDMTALLRLIRYLKGTSHLELVFSRGPNVPILFGYADASYINHPDGKSHTGTCVGFGPHSGMFHYRSVKQKTTALSSAEAEVSAATELTKDVVHLRDLLDELGFTQSHPTPLLVDNKSLITLATKFSGNMKRVRHFLVRINYLIEHVSNHTISVQYCPTADNTADVLTKSLPTPEFERHRRTLLGPQRIRSRPSLL